MRRVYTSRRSLLVLASVAFVATPSAAQQPDRTHGHANNLGAAAVQPARSVLIDERRVAQLDTLLPVLDDAGQVITEAQIAAATRTGTGLRTTMTIVGLIVGTAVFAVALPQPEGGADCSEYEPCTPREEFYRNAGVAAGAVVGALVFNLGPEYGRDRYKAVEYIRARRRAAQAAR